jgi:hypothetical protein
MNQRRLFGFFVCLLSICCLAAWILHYRLQPASAHLNVKITEISNSRTHSNITNVIAAMLDDEVRQRNELLKLLDERDREVRKRVQHNNLLSSLIAERDEQLERQKQQVSDIKSVCVHRVDDVC